MQHNNKILPLALVDWRLPVNGAAAVRLCAKYNIKSLQIDFGGPGRVPYLNDLKRQEEILFTCAQYGVQITALAGNLLNDIGLGVQFDRKDTKKLEDLLVSIIDTAEQLAIPLVFFPSFKQGAIHDQATFMRTARMLHWACQKAKDRKLLIGNENDLSPTLIKRLAEEVNADNFCFIFDNYNIFQAGHSVEELLTEMNDYFAPQVHIKDGLKERNVNVALGNGDSNLEDTINLLKQTSWVELYTLENDYRSNNLQQLQNDIFWLSEKIP